MPNVLDISFFDGDDGEEYYASIDVGVIKKGTSSASVAVLWEIDSGPNSIGRQGIIKKRLSAHRQDEG